MYQNGYINSYSAWLMQEIRQYWEIKTFLAYILGCGSANIFPQPTNQMLYKTEAHHWLAPFGGTAPPATPAPFQHTASPTAPWPHMLSEQLASTQGSREGTLSLRSGCRNASLWTYMALCGGKSLDEPLRSRATHFNLRLPRTSSP